MEALGSLGGPGGSLGLLWEGLGRILGSFQKPCFFTGETVLGGRFTCKKTWFLTRSIFGVLRVPRGGLGATLGGCGGLWGGLGETWGRFGGLGEDFGAHSPSGSPKIYIQTTDQPLLRPHII